MNKLNLLYSFFLFFTSQFLNISFVDAGYQKKTVEKNQDQYLSKMKMFKKRKKIRNILE